MNKTKRIASYFLIAAIVIGMSASAQESALKQMQTALQQMQNALVHLKKARVTGAVQAKSENLKKAKEQLLTANYDKGGYRAEAITLTMQATAKVSEFQIAKANQLIDKAIVKVKHAIQAIKQEASAKKKSASPKK
jgi:flavorubredoxin